MSKNFQALCALQAIMGREENALEVLTNDYFTNNNRRVYATALASAKDPKQVMAGIDQINYALECDDQRAILNAYDSGMATIVSQKLNEQNVEFYDNTIISNARAYGIKLDNAQMEKSRTVIDSFKQNLIKEVENTK